MQCNIDQRGRRSRIIAGVIVDLLGVGILVAGTVRDSGGLIVAGSLTAFAGMFMVFEGAKGWCVLRAMGFKTRM